MKLSYSILSETYYGQHILSTERNLVDRVYMKGDDQMSDFSVVWTKYSDGKPVAKLEAYHDAMKDLLNHSGFLAWIAGLNGANFTPQELVAQLEIFGYEDVTQRVAPEDWSGNKELVLDTARGGFYFKHDPNKAILPNIKVSVCTYPTGETSFYAIDEA